MSNRRDDQGIGKSLRDFRNERGADQTFQNLLRALTLNFELRARYRVFEFEASQDGHPETARLFRALWAVEQQQISDLLTQVHAYLEPAAAHAPEGVA